MVGLVIVSHSAALAAGVAELARGMGGEVPIELAGGIDAPEPALGTDAVRVSEAIERADKGDGVLVLMDLGSAVLSAEMALDLLPAERSARVLLSEAPLAEGAVAAAVTAQLGASLEEVAAEARGALQAKVAHLGTSEAEAPVSAATDGGALTVRLAVRNPLGLHARPAARFVQTAGSFDADVTVTNATTGGGAASGRSLNALATLGVRQGHELIVAARGRQAEEALAALTALAERDFDEQEPAVAAPTPCRLRLPTRAPSPVSPVHLGRRWALPATFERPTLRSRPSRRLIPARSGRRSSVRSRACGRTSRRRVNPSLLARASTTPRSSTPTSSSSRTRRCSSRPGAPSSSSSRMRRRRGTRQPSRWRPATGGSTTSI